MTEEFSFTMPLNLIVKIYVDNGFYEVHPSHKNGHTGDIWEELPEYARKQITERATIQRGMLMLQEI
jgi:hypothetical protein